MSFSSRIREELSRHMESGKALPDRRKYGDFKPLRTDPDFRGRSLQHQIHTENVTVARKCFTLLRKTFNIETDISIRRNAHLGKNRIYSVCETA